MAANAQKNFRLNEDDFNLLNMLSQKLGIDDTAIIKLGLRRLAEWEGVSAKHNGVQAFTNTGGKVTIRLMDNSTSGGATGLAQEEFEAYKKARLQAEPKNGGDLQKAWETLQLAGFEVYWL